MIRVSVLIPIYNVEKYIEKCLITLFNQTYQNIEYVFVDDCSKDSSIEILYKTIEQFPCRKNNVKIIKHPINMGLSAARNTALRNSTGEYIIHLDSDDYFDLTMIEEMVFQAKYTNADMVVCDFMLEYPNRSCLLRHNFSIEKNEYIDLLLCRKTIVSVVSRLMRRKVIVCNELYSVDNLNFGEDYVTSPRICYYCNKIVKINKPLYHYVRFNNDSYTHQISKKTFDDLIQANLLLESFFKEKLDIQIIEKSKIYNKITMLYISPKLFYDQISDLYRDVSIDKYNIKLLHRVLLYLCNNKFYNLLYFIIFSINKLRNLK